MHERSDKPWDTNQASCSSVPPRNETSVSLGEGNSGVAMEDANPKSLFGGWGIFFLKCENTVNTVFFIHLFDFNLLQKPIIITFFWVNQVFKTSGFKAEIKHSFKMHQNRW